MKIQNLFFADGGGAIEKLLGLIREEKVKEVNITFSRDGTGKLFWDVNCNVDEVEDAINVLRLQ
jgi:hypothetical protein